MEKLHFKDYEKEEKPVYFKIDLKSYFEEDNVFKDELFIYRAPVNHIITNMYDDLALFLGDKEFTPKKYKNAVKTV